VNTGDASATDLRRLIEHVQATVRAETGVALQREVHFAGDWSGWC
jgi:UDP-N-acetylenolpyruvoylglucosamine reductase